MEQLPTATLVEPLTIVIPAHNQAEQLRRHLPAILNQDYEEFEVVVVDIASTDDTRQFLEAMEQRYKYLRHSSTPSSARDISLERLALTLGIRSAQHEWVVLTQADAEPASNQWLNRIASTIRKNPTKELLLGFARYEELTNSWFEHKIGFFRLWHTIASYDHLQAGYAAVRGDGCNMAVRKSVFLISNCFADTQNLSVGACDLMANRLSTRDNTAIFIDPASVVIQDKPTYARWHQQRVEYLAIRQYQRHVFIYRMRNYVRLAWPWLALILIILPFIVGSICLGLALSYSDASYLHPLAMKSYAGQAPSVAEIVIFCVFLIFILVSLIIVTHVRIKQFESSAKALGGRNYYITLFLFELMMPFWTFTARAHYLISPKNEFRKKFI